MTAPGWYNAEGDPAGSQRYWDGGQWVGEPVFEPAAPAAVYGSVPAQQQAPAAGGYSYVGAPAGQSRFPSGLKTLAIVVSVVKAIPLVLGFIGAIYVALIADSIDDAFGEFDDAGIGSILGAAVAILFVILIIGALLVGFQFWGAIKERPMMIFVPALIMSLIDILFTLGSWSSYGDTNQFDQQQSVFSPLLMTVTMAAQITVAVWAIKANNKN